MINRIALVVGMAFVVGGPCYAQVREPAHVGTEDQSDGLVRNTTAVVGPVESGGEPDVSFAPEDCCPKPTDKYWIYGEGVLGWVQRTNVPTLVTTSVQGTSQANAGVLGLASTNSLFGGPMNDEVRLGLRVGAGCWFDEDRCWGAEVGFMTLESESTLFTGSTATNSIIARPFFNAVTNTQDQVLISYPGAFSGGVEAKASSGNFTEAHFDFVGNLCNEGWGRLDALVGYRYYHYGEGVDVSQTISPLGASFVPGTQIAGSDRFTTLNNFNGVDLGMRGDFSWGDFSLGALAKVALGQVSREIRIKGTQLTTVPGSNPSGNVGNVLALSTNVGDYNSSDWTMMPEFGGTLNWKINCHTRVYCGYSIMFLDEVDRAAYEINPVVNPGFFPPQQPPVSGPTEPSLVEHRNDVWIQTLTFGLEFSF